MVNVRSQICNKIYFLDLIIDVHFCLSRQLEKELQEQKKRCSSFRARPANVLYQEPFKPDKTNKPLTGL